MPQACRPEDCLPGTWFRLYGEHEGGPAAQLVLIDKTTKRGYVAAGGVFCEFDPEDRIIPLDEDAK